MSKISILMMTYNSERFINKAIESCLNQTYENFEICISDDGSTDKTVEIIENYKKKHGDKIRLHKFNENQGKISLAINANKAMSLCSGEYIAIMDPDEYMDQSRIQKQHKFLKENTDYIAVSHVKTAINYFDKKIIKDDFKFRNYGDISTEQLIVNGNLFSSCFMMRNKEEFQFNTRMKVMADWDFIIRMSLKGKLYVSQEKLTYKWMHDLNVTRTKNKEIRMDEWLTLSALAKEYESIKMVCYFKMLYLDISQSGLIKFIYIMIKSTPLFFFLVLTFASNRLKFKLYSK
jgi:glycosyltransferase involved in cell wall biosynthesis